MADWGTLGILLFGLIFGGIDDGKDLAVVKDDWEEDEGDVLDDWDADDLEEKAKNLPTHPKPKAPKPVKVKKPTEDASEPVIIESEQERKARLEKIVQERDLENALDLFGISGGSPKEASAPSGPSTITHSLFDTFTPTSIPEFDQFARIITKRFESFETHKHYPLFLEGLINALMSRREVPEIRKVAGVLSDMANVKNREKKIVSANANVTTSVPVAKAKVPPPSLQGAKKGGKGRFDDCFDYDDTDGFDE